MSQRRFHSDWNCSRCNFSNFGNRTNCKNCKYGKRPSNNNNSNSNKRSGDWNCSNCNFLNFKSRTNCKNCHSSKINPVSISPSNASIKSKPVTANSSADNNNKLAGDWNCTKCNYMNFASCSKCNRCNTAKVVKQLKTEPNEDEKADLYSNKDIPKDTSENIPKDASESNKDISKDTPKDVPKDTPKDTSENIPKDVAKDNEDIDEKKEQAEYSIMRKKQFSFTQTTKETGINIAVGKIAQAIVGAVGAYASGGALLPILATQIKNAVVHVNWSTSDTNESIVDHFFYDNCYLFLMIERDMKQKTKRIAFVKRKTCEIIANTKFLYIECGNDIAKKELQLRATQQAKDALKWIDDNKAGSW